MSTSARLNTTSTTTSTTTMQLEWCNLNQFPEITIKRLRTSKTIAIIDLRKNLLHDLLYNEAKNVCENICGNLYFPSTLPENNEVKAIFDDDDCNVGPTTCFRGSWIRLGYNETEKRWKDPDQRENLIFVNLHPVDQILDRTDPIKEHHAIMDSDGKWWSKSESCHYLSSHLACELT